MENGPFQRTEAMLLDPQVISVQPESEAISQSNRPQKKKNKHNVPQQNEHNKNFLKSNIGDFKMKILGAMHTTNQAIQNAGKKQDTQDVQQVTHTSGRDRSPSALQVHTKEQSLMLVPEASFPVANSEVQNTFDFYKSGDDLRQIEGDKSNNNSEIQFRATERSQYLQSQIEPHEAFKHQNMDN